MSNLYATEPVPNGKVIVDTTAGEIEIELWGKECPLAVRNFLQLTMEGYYDNVIFHRVVKGFIIQTGDPTGTGMGGQSIYDEPFRDEVHSRLKFNRRGLVGMANPGKRNSNNSQWFITLDRADELNGKHTLFGRVQGPTYYNVLNIGNLDVDEEERPKVPPKIKGIRIIENPFDDIVPRITAAEKREQMQARLEAKKEAERRERRAKAKKNTKLLSFGEAEEEVEEPAIIKKKDLGRRDLVATTSPAEDKPREKQKKQEEESKPEEERSEKRKAVDLKAIREEHARQKAGEGSSRKADLERMQEDLRALKKRMGEDSESDSDDDEKYKRRRKGAVYLEEEMAKYKKGRGRASTRHSAKGRRGDDEDLLRDLGNFTKKVLAMDAVDRPEQNGDEDGLEVDDDVDWMRHSLKFEEEKSEETRRAEDEYTVIDPRAKAREIAKIEEDAKQRARHRD